MGTLTLDELKDEVRRGMGGRTDLDLRLTRFLNLAQQRLARLHDYDEMETLSDASLVFTPAPTDGDIVLPNLRELYSIRIWDDSRSVKLQQRSPRWWDKMIPEPDYHSRDIPQIYTIWGNTVQVFPLPEKNYTNLVKLRWTKWPTPLSSPTAPSEFNEKDELLIELAIAYAYRSLGNPDEAAKHNSAARQLFLESNLTDREKPDLDMAGDASTGSMSPRNYWEDPFVRSIDGF